MPGKTKTSGNPPNDNDNLAHKIALTFYESAREEIMSRMRAREYTLLSFIIATSHLLAVGLYAGKEEILFCIPFLGVAFTFLVARHDFIIGELSFYCARELDPYLRNDHIRSPQWDASDTFHELTGSYLCARFLCYLMLLELMPFVSLSYTSEHALQSAFPNVLLWWLGAVFMFISFVILLLAHTHRWRLYKHKEWKWHNRNNRA